MEFEKENKFLRKENEQLKEQYKKVTGEDFDIQKYLDENNEEEVQILKINPKEKAKKELEDELKELKKEINLFRHNNITFDLQVNNLKNENGILNAKISNLESVFIGSNIVRNRDGSVFNNISGDYNLSSVISILFYKLFNFK